MGRLDVRGLLWGIGGLTVAFGLVSLLRLVPWATFGFAEWANTVQLFGTVLTFVGLFYAYARASDLRNRMKSRLVRAWRVLRRWVSGRGIDHTIDANSVISAATVGRPVVWVSLELRRTTSIQDQLDAVETYLNGFITGRIIGAQKAINRLSDELASARTATEASARETLEHIRSEIVGLEKTLNQKQVLDLRLAIAGLVVTGVGIVLNYFA